MGSTSRWVQWSGVPFSAGLRQRHDWNRSSAGEAGETGAAGVAGLASAFALCASADKSPSGAGVDTGAPLVCGLLKLESNAFLQRAPGALFFRGHQRNGVTFRPRPAGAAD